MVLKLSVLLPAVALLSSGATAAKSKSCPGHFGKKWSGRGKSKVANLCESHFPDAESEKIWFVKFYAPWCGHCNSMKEDLNTVANELATSDPDIGIGAVRGIILSENYCVNVLVYGWCVETLRGGNSALRKSTLKWYKQSGLRRH